jgi:hypothetical protein
MINNKVKIGIALLIGIIGVFIFYTSFLTPQLEIISFSGFEKTALVVVKNVGIKPEHSLVIVIGTNYRIGKEHFLATDRVYRSSIRSFETRTFKVPLNGLYKSGIEYHVVIGGMTWVKEKIIIVGT